MKKKNVALIGMPCSGKTSVGKIIAQKMNIKHIDVDKFIQYKFGICSISSFIEFHGEILFRKIEELALIEIANAKEFNQIILSTGGGAVLSLKNRELLSERFLVLHLSAPKELLRERLHRDTLRPKFIANNLNAIFESRKPLYKETSNIEIMCGVSPESQISESVINTLTQTTKSGITHS